jgi:hypothetical protein
MANTRYESADAPLLPKNEFTPIPENDDFDSPGPKTNQAEDDDLGNIVINVDELDEQAPKQQEMG